MLFYRYLLIIFFLLFSSYCSQAQYGYITGPDSVVLGGSAVFLAYVPESHGDILGSQWYTNSSSCNGCSVSYSLFTATYTFNALGSKEIEFEYDAENESDLLWKDVIVYDPPEAPDTPDLPVLIANCETAVLSRGVPPSGVTWYWQIHDDSHSMDSSLVTYHINQTGNYYLRARDNNTGVWSNYSSSLMVIVNDKPAQASGNDEVRCLQGAVTLTASPGSGGDIIKWYNSRSGGSAVHTGLQYSTGTVLSTKSFYATSYNTTWSCETDTRKEMQVIINTLPDVPDPTDEWICADEGTVELNADPGSGANNLLWYNSQTGGTSLFLGTTYETPLMSETTTYYVSSYLSTATDCESPRVPIIAAINAVPLVSAGPDKDLCYNDVVSLNGSPAGGSWSGSYINDSIFNASNAGIGSYEAIYTYKEYYNVGYCHGRDTVNLNINLETPEKPLYPTVYKNFWSEWQLVKAQSPSNEIWYWQGTDVGGKNEADLDSLFIASTTNQYYLRAKNTDTDCWSDPTVINVVIATDSGYDNFSVNEPLKNN